MAQCTRCGKKGFFLRLENGICGKCATLLHNEYLLEWQKTVIDTDRTTLIATESQLREITKQQVENDLRIITDCVKLIESTLNPDVFFMRLDLLIEKSQHLCALEKYARFSGASPSDAYKQAVENYQAVIKQFLYRYFSNTYVKAHSLKTDSGKAKRLRKSYEALEPFREKMNADNIAYTENLYQAYIRHYE